MATRPREQLFLSVRDQLLSLIKQHYKPGSRLASESELARQLRVSRVTLREALRVLEEDGVVVRRHGIGTFVKDGGPVLASRLDLNFGVTDVIESQGMEAGTLLVSIGVQLADPTTAEKLRLGSDTRIWRIERVRTANGKPLVFSTDVLPLALVPNPGLLDTFHGSLYSFLEQECGLLVAYGVANLVPIRAGHSISEQLCVHPNSLLLLLEQVDYTHQDAPLLYSREYHLGDSFAFTVCRRPPRGLDERSMRSCQELSNQFAVHQAGER